MCLRQVSALLLTVASMSTSRCAHVARSVQRTGDGVGGAVTFHPNLEVKYATIRAIKISLQGDRRNSANNRIARANGGFLRKDLAQSRPENVRRASPAFNLFTRSRSSRF